MQLSEDEIIEKYAKKSGHCLKKHYHHTNMKLLAFRVVTMLTNESKNSVKFNENK